MGEESGKMASWVIYLIFIIFSGKHCVKASLPTYTFHNNNVNFEQAAALCSPGVLTTLATMQEVTEILRLISEGSRPQGKATFWIGLKKAKETCVISSLPLRGFHWTEDGSTDSEVNRWTKEPVETCTAARCGTLQVQLDGSAAPKWGLVAVTCKNASVYPFICKLKERDNSKPDPPNPGPVSLPHQPDSPEYKPAAPQPHHPDQPEPTAPGQHKLDPVVLIPAPTEHHEPEAPKQEPETPKPPRYSTPEPEYPIGKPELGTHVEANVESNLGPGSKPSSGLRPGIWSNDCQNPIIPGSRSLSPDPNNSSRMLVECWSTVQVKLQCQGRPATWHLLSDTPANFTTLCKPCSIGFHKDISGVCKDVDECSGAPCKHTCLNTRGSYRCVCYDKNGKHHEEGSTECMDMVTEGGALSGIWVPVLIAVGALVVLVVAVVVIVKCYLMSKKKRKEGDGQ